jgi:hypothetical protein
MYEFKTEKQDVTDNHRGVQIFWQMNTTAIVPSFAGGTCKSHNKWYI